MKMRKKEVNKKDAVRLVACPGQKEHPDTVTPDSESESQKGRNGSYCKVKRGWDGEGLIGEPRWVYAREMCEPMRAYLPLAGKHVSLHAELYV